jgi:ferredoxin-NADP reductase
MARAALRGRLSWQIATVEDVVEETARVKTIVLDVPDWPGHRAGQHLDIRLTAEDGYRAEREYSIASAPGEPVG